MNRIQTVARSAVAIGAVGVAVLGFAPTASATSNDTLTVSGVSTYTFTSNQSPQIQGIAQSNCSGSPAKVVLTISGPGVVSPTLVSADPNCSSPQTIQPTDTAVNTAHPDWSGGTPAMDGNYTVTLNNEGRTTQAKFTVLIPPAKTTGFTVSPSGTSATFKWTANAEPDVVAYVIKDAAGNPVATPTKACSGTKCSDGPISLGSSVAGQTEKFSIIAVRSCGDATCPTYGAVPGIKPAVASAKFAAATSSPSPTPTKSSGTGGSASGGTKTTHKGSTGTLSDPSATKSKHHKAKKKGAGLPSFSGSTLPSIDLPSLPTGSSSLGGTAATTAGGEPTTLGKPGGNLNYPAPQVATKKKVTVATGGGISHEISVAVNRKPLWRGIAAAAVMLLIAVHLRTWAGRTDDV